jgi:small acid-soluble spore protein (thioredoxin-like protein)
LGTIFGEDCSKNKGGIKMTRNNPRPNDPADYEERVNKTIGNMEAAEEAMKFAEGKELEAIKKKNARREESITGSNNEKNEDNRS